MPAPSAGFNIFAGTSGDFLAALLAYTSNTDVVVVPGTPPTPAQLLELGKWDFNFRVNGATFTGFSSPADLNGVIYPLLLKGGIADWGFTVEGAYNGDSGSGADTYSRLRPGAFVYGHLLFHKASGYGWRGLAAKVMSFGPSTDVESQKPAGVRIELKGHGLLAAPTFSP